MTLQNAFENLAVESKQDSQITILSAVSAKLPASLGAKTSAASLSVVLASDQATIPVDIQDASISVTGPIAVTQATGTNLHTVVDSGTISTITNVVHIDDNAGSLTVDGTVTANLAAGTNAIGKLAANDGIDIGDVTINNASGASAVNIQDGGNSITVDQATGTNLHTVVDSGTITTVSTVSTITNVVHVDDNAGSLTVDGTVAATQSGNWTLANTSATFIQDNLAFTDGTTRVSMAGFIFDEVAGTALTENDGAAARIDSKRALVNVIEDATTRGQRLAVGSTGAAATNLAQIAGTTADVNSGVKSAGTQRVVIATDQPAFTTAMPVTLASGATAIAKAEDVASADADVGVPALAVRKASPGNTSGTDGDYEFLQMSAGRLWASATIDAALPAGTNEIGGVNVTKVAGTAMAVNSGATSAGTQRVILASDQTVVPASASAETASIYSGTTALTPKFATIVASASGVTQVVALVAAKKIRVLNYVLTAAGAVNAKFQSHTTPTDKTGLLYLAGTGGVSSPYSPVGLFETVAGEALDINLSAAVAVGGHLTYIEV